MPPSLSTSSFSHTAFPTMNTPLPRQIIDGIVLVDKPIDISSNQVLQQVRWIYRAKKAGHGGTLDPFATGLLPILFGDGSKFSRYFLDGDKTYEVTLAFGSETDSGDLTGNLIRQAPIPALHTVDWQVLCQHFTGIQQQIPPVYSALNVNGQRAYELARQGKSVELAARRITIHAIHLLSHDERTACFHIRCSKGTYIRSLVRDIAAFLGSAGHATALRRLAVAGLNDMTPLADLRLWREADDQIALQRILLPLETCIAHLPRIDIPTNKARYIRNGNDIACPAPDGESALYDDGKFIGVGEARDGRVYPVRLCRHVNASETSAHQ